MDITTSTIITDTFSMDYFSFGTGKTPFVMLPGISTVPITTFAPAIANAYKDFATSFTVYVFNRRDDLPGGCTIADLADDTAAAMDKLGIANACVFSTSMGGMIAQALTVKRPDLVQKLILTSTTCHIDSHASQLFDSLLALAESGNTIAMCEQFAKAVYTPSFFECFKDAIIALYSTATNKDIARFATLLCAVKAFDITDQLEKISCPALVIAGGEDAIFSTDHAKLLAEKTGAELCIYDGYGHAVYDESPDIKAKIMEFFTK